MNQSLAAEYIQRTEADLERRRRELQARQELTIQTKKRTPAKTISAFAGKIKEYTLWYEKEGYADDIVTDDKTITF